VIALVRHGQTQPNREGLLLGRSDPPLTDTGRAQAEDLAAEFRGAPIERVVSSPLDRARATAEMIAATRGIAVEVDERLIELDYGAWEGQPLSALPRELLAEWRVDPRFAPPGGESLRAVGERVASFCDNELRHASALTVAVSHVSPIKAAVAWALNAGDELAWRMRLDVASVTRIGRGPVLLSFNETGHLR
jgi:probable phosphoglycerate mutase